MLGNTIWRNNVDDYVYIGPREGYPMAKRAMTRPEIEPVAASRAKALGPGHHWSRSVPYLENRVWLALRVSGACAWCWTEKVFSRVRPISVVSLEDGMLCTASLARVELLVGMIVITG